VAFFFVSRRSAACSVLLVVLCSTASAVTFSESPLPTAFEEFRSFDGVGNNISNPSWGSVDTPLLRQFMPADYEDGIAQPRTSNLPGAREVSNAFAMPSQVRLSPLVSDFFWQWGQFLDHDLDLTGTADPAEPFDILVPLGDPFFDPEGTGAQVIRLDRSTFAIQPGPREQINQITAFIDGSNVYGANAARAMELRTLDGTGRLKTSAGNLLPFNLHGYPNAPDDGDPRFFLAGDLRANEQAALTAMHTLFLREHNYQAERISTADPQLDGDAIYLRARALIGAQIQVITFREFLPILLGADALPPYEGYDPLVHPGIENAFSAMIYRFGHSMLSPQLLQLAPNGEPILQGPYPLRRVFFSPEIIIGRGIEPFLRGLAAQPAQQVDPFLVDDVRNFLFGRPGSGGLDLGSLNIQRGRDHGMARYNACRTALGLSPWTDLTEISSDPEITFALTAAYDDVSQVDGWAGALAETALPNALVGETSYMVMLDQFERLRDGDRFWYENYLAPEWVEYVEAQRLSDIIRRNSSIDDIQNNVFVIQTTTDVSGALDSPDATSFVGLPFPNPSRDGVSFYVSVPDGSSGQVEVDIFDARGRSIRTLQDGSLQPGNHLIRWNRKDDDGRRVAAGFYFARAKGDFGASGRKLIVRD